MKELNESKNHEEVLTYMIGKSLQKLDDTYVLDKLIGASRKNCVIILENFDRNKITKREDNKRILY